MLAQHSARVLIQRLDVIGHVRTQQDTHRFDHAERETARKAVQGLVFLQGDQRLEQRGDLAVDEMLQAALHLGRHIRTGLLVDKGHDTRLERIIARGQLAHSLVAPHEAALLGVIHLGIGRVVEPVGAQVEMRRERLHRRGLQRLRLLPGCILVLAEPEPFEPADEFAFDGDFTLVIHFGQKGLLLLQPPQQHGCAPVNKSLGQALVERIRQSVFYSARLLAPMAFVMHPRFPLRDIGPCADIRQPFRQRVNVAIGPVDPVDLSPKEIIGDGSALMQVSIDNFQEPSMFRVTYAAKVGNAADIPQKLDRFGIGRPRLYLGHGAERLERLQIIRLARLDQQLVIRAGLE